MKWTRIKDYIPGEDREVLMCGFSTATDRYHYCIGKLGPKNNMCSITVNIAKLRQDKTFIQMDMMFWCELEGPKFPDIM